MAVQLRVFPESFQDSATDDQAPSVHVRLSELLPLVALAKRHNYLWLQDFLEDEVCITTDLYEILRAFSSCRRPSA